MSEKPTLGRIVHYYEGDYEAPRTFGYGDHNRHEWRGTNGTRVHPAIITCVHANDCVNLHVFFDGAPTQPRTSMCRLPDEVFAEGMRCTNAGWRWPPRA